MILRYNKSLRLMGLIFKDEKEIKKLIIKLSQTLDNHRQNNITYPLIFVEGFGEKIKPEELTQFINELKDILNNSKE